LVFQTVEDLFAGIGGGTISPITVIGKVRADLQKEETVPAIEETQLLLKLPEKKKP